MTMETRTVYLAVDILIPVDEDTNDLSLFDVGTQLSKSLTRNYKVGTRRYTQGKADRWYVGKVMSSPSLVGVDRKASDALIQQIRSEKSLNSIMMGKQVLARQVLSVINEYLDLDDEYRISDEDLTRLENAYATQREVLDHLRTLR